MFAEEFTKEIIRTGKTQKYLAEQLGIPLRTLEDWKSGRRVPPTYVQAMMLDKIKKINPGV